jgi:hypothetical protein
MIIDRSQKNLLNSYHYYSDYDRFWDIHNGYLQSDFDAALHLAVGDTHDIKIRLELGLQGSVGEAVQVSGSPAASFPYNQTSKISLIEIICSRYLFHIMRYA